MSLVGIYPLHGPYNLLSLVSCDLPQAEFEPWRDHHHNLLPLVSCHLPQAEFELLRSFSGQDETNCLESIDWTLGKALLLVLERWRHRGSTYLTSLPLVSVRHHGRVKKSVEVEIKFHLECNNLCCDKCIHRTLISVSIVAKYPVS